MSLTETLKHHYNYTFDKKPLKEAIDLIEDKELKELVTLNYDCLAPWNKETKVSSFREIIQITSNDYCKPLITFLTDKYTDSHRQISY